MSASDFLKERNSATFSNFKELSKDSSISGFSLSCKASYRSMGTTGDPVPVGQRDVPVNHFTG
jgi:hypothetical protein